MNFGLITIRAFLWEEVKKIGGAYARGGYGSYIQYVYISRRSISNKERFDILHIKDRKNFIAMENRGNIIEALIKYSKKPFRPLPNIEDYKNI